jgi:hypothetical protein
MTCCMFRDVCRGECRGVVAALMGLRCDGIGIAQVVLTVEL